MDQGCILFVGQSKQQFLFLFHRIIMPLLTDENHPTQAPFSILHHSKHKSKLTSSLMLASTFISNKQKISKAREVKQQRQQSGMNAPLLMTNRLNVGERKWPGADSQRGYSNIQELKCRARKLEEEQVVKLGKENVDQSDISNKYIESAIDMPAHKVRQRKMNRRKIVKGRPQMYALIRKRKFLTSLNQEQPQGNISVQHQQGHIRETINQILHKHHQAEVYGLKYHTPLSRNQQFWHLSQEKSEALRQGPHQSRQEGMRASVSDFNTIENDRGRGKVLAHDATSPLIRPKQRHHSLVSRRFSVSNTIE